VRCAGLAVSYSPVLTALAATTSPLTRRVSGPCIQLHSGEITWELSSVMVLRNMSKDCFLCSKNHADEVRFFLLFFHNAFLFI